MFGLSQSDAIQFAIAVPMVCGGIWAFGLVMLKVAKTIVKIDRILHEVTPNGGTSIKDAVARLDQHARVMDKTQEEQLRRLDKIERIVEELRNK